MHNSIAPGGKSTTDCGEIDSYAVALRAGIPPGNVNRYLFVPVSFLNQYIPEEGVCIISRKTAKEVLGQECFSEFEDNPLTFFKDRIDENPSLILREESGSPIPIYLALRSPLVKVQLRRKIKGESLLQCPPQERILGFGHRYSPNDDGEDT